MPLFRFFANKTISVLFRHDGYDYYGDIYVHGYIVIQYSYFI